MQCRTPRRRHPSYLVRIQQIGLIDGQCLLDGREDRWRRRGGGEAVARRWLLSIYNTHNQKRKDKERLRLRGGAPHASAVSQNSSSKIGFLQRTSAATWADITKYHPATSVMKFDHSPVRPRPRSTSLPEDCVAAQRNMSPSHICPALRGLSRGPPLAVAFHTYL